MKFVKTVPPYIHPEFLNFKTAPYIAWKDLGGNVTESHYPWKIFHGLFFRYELPSVKRHCRIVQRFKGSKVQDVHLCFVEPVSIYFDSFPSYLTTEVIPFVWDCWPCFFEKMCTWIERHHVSTAIFTSSQTAERMQKRFPHLNMMFCPEGVDTSKYTEGKSLKDRSIDLLEFGRSNEKVIPTGSFNGFNHVTTKVGDNYIYDNEQLYEAMGDAKVTICLPRSITQPEVAGDIETLTQRYWECMLSRIVMVGHAPKELIDLIGYNPCVEIDGDSSDVKRKITNIIGHIEGYQALVDKNRVVALQYGGWKNRMCQVMGFLESKGYKCSW